MADESEELKVEDENIYEKKRMERLPESMRDYVPLSDLSKLPKWFKKEANYNVNSESLKPVTPPNLIVPKKVKEIDITVL